MTDYIDEMPEAEVRERFRRLGEFSTTVAQRCDAAELAMQEILHSTDVTQAKRVAYEWIEAHGGKPE